MPKGFLAVLSEPGQVPLDEFHDWYDNEHIPIRLNHLCGFLTGARFFANDGKKPSWIALYDIDSTSTFDQPSYTRLRENRSPREAALIKRLDVLDRRILEVLFENENEQMTAGTAVNTGLAMGNPAQWVFTHGIELDGERVWELAKVWSTIKETVRAKGLIRSRMFKCLSTLKTGVAVSSDPKEHLLSRYFAVHELTSREDFQGLTEALTRLNSNNPGIVAGELREWQIYRAYPCIAQGNLPENAEDS